MWAIARPGEETFRNSRFTADATRVSTSTTPLVTKITLTPGLYWFYSTVAGRFKQGPDAVAVSSTTGTPIAPNQYFGPVWVDNCIAADANQNNRIDAIADTGTGVFECIPILA